MVTMEDYSKCPDDNGLILELDNCCIECAAKRRVNQICETLLFDLEDDVERQERDYNLLLDFLRTSDFPALRSKHRLLDGNYKLKVKLMLINEDRFRIVPLALPDTYQETGKTDGTIIIEVEKTKAE